MKQAGRFTTHIVGASLLLISFSPCLSRAAEVSQAKPNTDSSSTAAVVQTDAGKVRGYIHTGTFTFKGIPYAVAERFMPPEKPKPWEGVRSSMSFGHVAMQGTGGPVDATAARASDIPDEDQFFVQGVPQVQGEDCQRVNIWTPGINDNSKRPVMVWLHGGGFSTGSGSGWQAFDGEGLSKKGNVVVVTLNHRLNVLGFLDLSAFGDKYKYSGNVGMMDIVAALNWIHTNIASFGGDPGNVTIFGQSGGGGKVSVLMATPSAHGLFQRAIVESGSTLRVGESATTRKVGAKVLEILGLKPEQVDELQKIPYSELSKAGDKAWAQLRQEAGGGGQGMMSMMRFGWSPTVDGDFLPTQPFDPSAPELSKDIPLMVGSTLNEMFPSERNPALRNVTQAQAEEFLQTRLGPNTKAYIEEFGKVYPGYKPVDLIDTDYAMRPRAIQQASLKAAQHGAPVYMYRFDWQTPVLDGIHKAFHTAEIPFIFNNIALSEHTTGGSKEAYALADKVSQAWINFARTGNPNHPGLPKWPAYTDEKRATMIFDNKSVVRENFDSKLLDIANAK